MTKSQETKPVLLTSADFETVCDSYSADRIAEAKPIRQPFEVYGRLCVCVGSGAWNGSQKTAQAYLLTPLAEFKGTPTNYADKTHHDLGFSAREDPQGFYHGMTVKQGRNTYVLTGPELRFTKVEEQNHA